MNCERAREILPELLDHPRPAPLSREPSDGQSAPLSEARAHLANCPDCQREFAALTQTAAALDAMPTPPPSPRLRQNFYAMLEEEKHSAISVSAAAERQHRAARASLWRWIISPLAGCALLALGYQLGQRGASSSISAAASGEDAMKREVVAMRDQLAQQRAQLDKMTTLVGYSILQQQQNPANERLKEVLAAAKTDKPSDKVIDDLIYALTLDPNANVRLRALEALYPHAEREVVRAGVLAALPREQNPLVQLELIDFVAAAQDRNATPVLEKLSADESLERSVREAAKLALAQL